MTRRPPQRRPGNLVTNERWAAFMRGEITVADMDDEEIARGTFKAADGTFRGRPPNTVPRDFATQLGRELLLRAESKLKARLLEAIDVQVEIMRNGEKDADRLRAAMALQDRLLGKVPDRVVVSAGRPEWEEAVDAFLTGVEDEQIQRARTVLGRNTT